MKILLLIVINMFMWSKFYAQQSISYTITTEVCDCINKETTTITQETYLGVYQKCLLYAMTRNQKAINEEYGLKANDPYQKGKEAGEKLRKQVDELMIKNCDLHRMYLKQK